MKRPLVLPAALAIGAFVLAMLSRNAILPALLLAIAAVWMALPKLTAIVRAGLAFVLGLTIVALGAQAGGTLPETPPAAQAPPAAAGAVSEPRPSPTPAPAQYDLELVSSRGSVSSSDAYMEVVGEVRNVSGRSLPNVLVVTSWYTDTDELITTDDTLIEYTPILAGQVSPFKSLVRRNPAMKRFRVDFKTMGGGTLRVDRTNDR